MSKEFTVTTYDYNHELGVMVTIDFEDFKHEEDALQYATTVQQTADSKTVVRGDYGYKHITTITKTNNK